MQSSPNAPLGPRTAQPTACNNEPFQQYALAASAPPAKKQRRVNQDPYGGDGIDIDILLEEVTTFENPIVHFDFEKMLDYEIAAPTFEHSQAVLRLKQVSGHLSGSSSVVGVGWRGCMERVKDVVGDGNVAPKKVAGQKEQKVEPQVAHWEEEKPLEGFENGMPRWP